MVQQHRVVMFSSYSISAIQPLACSVILSSTTRLSSIMEPARGTIRSSNISLPIYSSLESFVIQTEPSMSAVLVIENVWQEGATVSLWERHVSVQQTATLISTVTFSLQRLVKKQYNRANCATLQICVIWVGDVGSTPVKPQVENA